MNKEVQKLIDISRRVGVCPDLVQGAGGNVSVKRDDGIMYIKASGTSLKDMAPNKGIVAVDRGGSVVNPDDGFQRPSMEVGMHLSLARYAIHTHPVHVNIFTCMEGGKRYLYRFFSEQKPLYITYKNPGKALASEVRIQVLRYRNKHKENPQIIFLENHGLITCGEDAEQVVELTLYVNDTLRTYLQNRVLNFEQFDIANASFERPDNCLFPDMAVFVSIPPRGNAREIFAAHEYVLSTIKKLGARPRYLTSAKVNFIQSMESEKYRIAIATSNK